MTPDESFDTRLNEFYAASTPDEQELLAFMCAATLLVSGALDEPDVEGFTQARSDLGQQLQFALQEANNIYTRSNRAQSDISSKYSQTLNGIAQNLK